MNIPDQLVRIASYPMPLRALLVRKLLQRFPIGSYEARLRASAVTRPWYGWCLFAAAKEARSLGYSKISAIEFGVAKGTGLLVLSQHAEEVRRVTGVEVLITGFDTGQGLPETGDTQDLQYYWTPGSFVMDRAALEKRLGGRAKLVLGDVAETVPAWQPPPDAPLGMVVLDMDLHSSTAAALPVLEKEFVLPRIWCYLDDITGDVESAYTDRTAVLEAVHEFNAEQEQRGAGNLLLPAYCFRDLRPEPWHEQIYVYHRQKHPQYNTVIVSGKHEFKPLYG